MSKKRIIVRPQLSELKEALARERYKQRYRRTLRTTLFSLVVVAAVSVLAATIWFPVMKIFSGSMTPTLTEGDIVVSVRTSSFRTGEVVGCYYGNQLIVKRIIAGPGDWVDIKEDGTVFVNGRELIEPYIDEKAFGDCDIELPCQVHEGRYFVMGDHRSTSIDSRHTTVGCIAEDQIVGKIVLRVWPLPRFGSVN